MCVCVTGVREDYGGGEEEVKRSRQEDKEIATQTGS